MVKLFSRLIFTVDVAPIPFPKQEMSNWLDDHTAETVHICGWGKDTASGNEYPDELHCVNVELINHNSCNGPLSYDGTVYDGMFCAGIPNEGGKDACQGDSGKYIYITTFRAVTIGFFCFFNNFAYYLVI